MKGQSVIDEVRKQLAVRPSNLLPSEFFQQEKRLWNGDSWDDTGGEPWVNWHNGPIFENWTDCSASVAE